ncbi:reverse transcriptase domain-containing protein [Tanacetum coccineum]|uniref:Reverse transcriptase domain-containing protein n=1 Tax=Tanacetum coccineum TaxID=301880 RepID=A0ABQ5H617_9ASTR
MSFRGSCFTFDARFAPTIKSLLMNKEKLLELANIPLNENCSAMLLKKLPEKLGDPRKFLIPCYFLELRAPELELKDLPSYLEYAFLGENDKLPVIVAKGQVYQSPPIQPPVYQAPPQQIQGVSKTDFENYVKANDVVLRNMQNQGQGLQNQMRNLTEMLSKFITSNTASSSNSGTLPSETVTNPREHVNAITTQSGKTCEGHSTPLVPTPIVSNPLKEPEQNLETSMDKVQKPSLESTAQVPPPEEEDSIFIEIPKPKAKKTVNIEIQEPNSPKPTSYQPKLPYPERMKVRENDKPSAQHSRFLKMFKQLRLEIGLKDALVEMPKFNKWLSSLLRNKEKLEEIAITTINVECSAIIMNKVPEKLEDPGKFLIPCALQELDRTNALADSRASINLLPHSIYKQLGLGALTPTRMTLELANRSITYPMGIAEDVVGDLSFAPQKLSLIYTRKKLTLRVGSDELVFYAEKSEKSKNKQFAHAISVIDFSKDEPFSGSTTNHSDALPPSSSPVKTSEILEEFADELTLPKKVAHEENFQVYSNPLFEFDDNFISSNENPLFNEMDEDVVNKNSNVSNEPVLLNTPLSDKVECFAPEDDIDEIDAFLAMEVSSNFEEGYFDSEGDVTFLDNLLSDDTTHNLAPEVISDHEPEQNESSITFSPRSDPLHHEFAGEIITLPSRNDREFEEYLSLMTVLCEISTSRSQENVHANQSSIIESLPVSPIPVEDSEPVQEEIDIFLVPDDLIPPGVENDDSEDEDNELPNLDHQDNPSSPRPPPEPSDVFPILVSVGCQKPGHLAARLGCAETKVATWDDLAFKLIILRWNVKHSTDKAEITRKPSKNGQTRTREQKSVQEPEAKVKKSTLVNSQSTKVKNATWKKGKHKGMIDFTLEALTQQAQKSHQRIASLAIREMLRNCHGHNLSKGNIIKIFYHGLSEVTQEVLNATASGSSNSDTDKIMARMDAITLKMDAQYKELQTHAKKTKPDLDEDDIPMSREEEAKFMHTFQSTNAFVKETFMDLKTQLETVAKNHQASIQNLETKFDRLADKQSGRPSGSLPSNTQPNPKGHNSKSYQPPQSRNEHVNVVFTRSGKSYNPPVNPNDQPT